MGEWGLIIFYNSPEDTNRKKIPDSNFCIFRNFGQYWLKERTEGSSVGS